VWLSTPGFKSGKERKFHLEGVACAHFTKWNGAGQKPLVATDVRGRLLLTVDRSSAGTNLDFMWSAV
jgi:hypothetical protein